MLVRITVMVLRVSVLVTLILGILFWTNIVAESSALIGTHMFFGILVTLSLLVLGGIIAFAKGGNLGLGLGAIILGLLIVGLGMSQRTMLVGNLHWLIQVLHLLFGLAAIGLGEMIAGRYKRLNIAKA